MSQICLRKRLVSRGERVHTFAIDVVICTYNNANLLERTLAALSCQQVPEDIDWSVLVVDNNCTDDTPELVERFRQNGLLKVRRVVEPRQGLTWARRCGVQQTTSDWIAFVDDDCVLQENWIREMVHFIRQHPTCGAVGGKVILDWQVPPQDYISDFGWAFAQQDHGVSPTEVDFLAGAGMVLNRHALRVSGWIDQALLEDRTGDRLISGGDVEMALRVKGAGFPLWYNPSCTIHHIIPARRMTRDYMSKVIRSLGVSQVLGDALVWTGTFREWFIDTLSKTGKKTVGVLWRMVKALMRRRNVTPSLLDGCFVLGNWIGIVQMLYKHKRERSFILGAAKRRALYAEV